MWPRSAPRPATDGVGGNPSSTSPKGRRGSSIPVGKPHILLHGIARQTKVLFQSDSDRMDLDVVRLMIRRRLVERRLPHEGMASVESGPGAGQMCVACGANITSDHVAMIGVPSVGGRPGHFHALCFRIWD